MRSPVREQPVDHHADDGEEEDDKAPEDLLGGRPVRLQDLDCESESISNKNSRALIPAKQHCTALLWIKGR